MSRCALVVSLAAVLFARYSFTQAATTVSYDTPLLWTDRAGNTHPAKYINVEWWDDDTFIGEGSTLQDLGFNASDGSGNVTFTTNEDDYGTNIEFFTRIRAGIQNVTSVKNQLTDTDPFIVRFPGGTSYVSVSEGSTSTIGSVTVDDTTNAGTAISITQPINFMTNYYKNTLGATIPYLPVQYNNTITGSSYTDNDHLDLRYGAWGAWDVIMHEWGHHIAYNNNLDGKNFGGVHYAGANNIASANPGPGARLAYGEAVATHLELMGIKEGNLAAAIPGLPAADYNNTYDSYQSTASTTTEANLDHRYSLENNTSQNLVSPNNQGEGDEAAVGRAMWDFYDTGTDNENYTGGNADHVGFGAQKFWNVMKNKGTFQDLWKGVANAVLADKTLVGLNALDTDFEVLSTAGEVLQEYAIAGEPTTKGDVDPTPDLVFSEENSDLSRSYRWLVMDDNWNLVLDSGRLLNPTLNLLQNVNWTVPAANALTVGHEYWWVILSSSALDLGNDPGGINNWYWSGANLLNVIPEPTSLAALLSLAALASLKRERI